MILQVLKLGVSKRTAHRNICGERNGDIFVRISSFLYSGLILLLSLERGLE